MVTEPGAPRKRFPTKAVAWTAGLGCAALLLAAVIFLPGVFLAVALWSSSVRTVFERAASPDGWHEARVQFDDCGAGCRYDRVVLVKNRFNPSDEPLFSCRAFLADGERPVHLRWMDNRTLLIQHRFPPSAIGEAATQCGQVRIVVQAQAPR